MQLYFIRHGQSQNNAHWQDPGYTESPDPDLTDLGREQALCLAEYLHKNQPLSAPNHENALNRRGYGLTHLYCSLMSRAVDTAAPTARVLGIPWSAWPEIHEEGGIYSRGDKTNLSGLPGKPRSYFEKNFPELVLPASLDESGWYNRPFETEPERQPRADQFLLDLLARHGDQEGQPEDHVAIVSHGGFFMRFLSAMLQLPWRQAAAGMKSWFGIYNGSISRFDFTHGDLTVCYINRLDHLPDHLITG